MTAFGARADEVVIGFLMDNLPQAREEHEEGTQDNILIGLHERLAEARSRRIAREDAKQGQITGAKAPPASLEGDALTVNLDPEASALVQWAGRTFGRHAADTASAAIEAALQQAREENEHQEFSNQVDHIQGFLAAAGNRRIAREDATGGHRA